MAEVDGVPTFGTELKDGFKQVSAWAGHGILWLDDIQAFYRERSVIEKEYSAKLAALAKRHYEKKNKKTAQLSVGDSPTMTPGSLESASLTTWTTQLTTLEARAAEHDGFANDLIAQVAEPLKILGVRLEELRKRQVEYADKLAAERDASYSELRKAKTKYDAACQEVEAKRKKSESHYDKAKAQSAYQQQIFEMNNAKNTYLISVNVTNRLKERYYNQYIPEVMDSLQDLTEFRTLKLNGLWALACRLEKEMLQRSCGLMEHLAGEIMRNEPHLDSMMYLRHNMGAFQEPPDKEFEPSPVWHDDDIMVVDETAKVYLRNVLSKSKSQLGEYRREVDKRRTELEGSKRRKLRVRDGSEAGDEIEMMRALSAMQEELHNADRRRLASEVETSTIISAVGDVTLGARSHNFRSQTFKIPTNCDLCGERIWGLSAKGFDCRDCGYTCHGKCEMKVPADCPGEQSKEERKKLKAERQEAANKLTLPDSSHATHVAESLEVTRSNTMTSLSSRSARRSPAGTPADDAVSDGPSQGPTSTPVKSSSSMARRNRVVAPPPAAYVGDKTAVGSANGSRDKEETKGRMLYHFDASGETEISVPEGREIVLLEPDDGSGWVKIRAGYKEGLVPATYVEVVPGASRPRPSSTYSNSTSSSAATAAKKKGPAVAPRRGAKKLRYVEALYEYTAQSESEHSMVEGERFVLIKDDPGDGWVEVEKAGVTASVPASYVQVV